MKHFRNCLLLSLLAALLLVLAGVPARAEFQKTKIAVLDFEMIGDKMETASMGAIISEWFITGIVKSGRFDVVERAMLQKILSEQKLGTSGMIDEQSAAALGKVLGVKAIISGSLLKLQDAVDINARVISVESGSIIAAENIRSSGKSDLHALVDELIGRILQNFPLTGYVVKKGDKTAIIDLGLDSGLSVGTEFIVYREGEVIKHPKTGEVLDVEQIHTGRLRIAKVSKNVAEGTIVREESNGGIQYGQMVKSVKKEETIAKGKEKVGTVAPSAAEASAPPVKPEAKIESKSEDKSESTDKAAAPSAKAAAPAKATKVKADKKKVETEPPVPTAPVPAPVAPPPKFEEKAGGDLKVAIFPWVMRGDGGSFAGILADRIRYHLADGPGLVLTASSYQIKNVADFGAERAQEYFRGSDPNLEALRKKGKELGVDVAVIGTLNVHCRYSDECSLRSIEAYVIDLESGAMSKETGLSHIDAYANEGINSAVSKAIKGFAAARRQKDGGAKITQNKVSRGGSGEYRVAVFPWLMGGAADTFAGILADRLFYHLAEVKQVKLTHAAYTIKGVTMMSGLKASTYVGSSGPNVEELRRKGGELGVDGAIVGRLNVRCRFADQCSVESMTAYFVDLDDGTVLSQSGDSGMDSYAQDAIDATIVRLSRQLAARRP
jgi:TolB-like protein